MSSIAEDTTIINSPGTPVPNPTNNQPSPRTENGGPSKQKLAHQASGALDSTEIEYSLWASAYTNLTKENPDLVKKFRSCLKLDNQDIEDATFSDPRTGSIAQEALDNLHGIFETTKNSNKISDGIKKYFEKTVKIVLASKDFISLAVSASPPAALAWTAVSSLLPVSLPEIFSFFATDQEAPPSSISGARRSYQESRTSCNYHDSLKMAGETVLA